MIPTFDLRLGNWITADNVIYRVSGVCETKVYFKGHEGDFNPEALHPIFITHEILERAGFKRREGSDLYDKVPNEGFTYQLHSHKIMLFQGRDNTLAHWLTTRLVFVHQLQNFYYYLAGREIPISF
jgi:hypothetical protein